MHTFCRFFDSRRGVSAIVISIGLGALLTIGAAISLFSQGMQQKQFKKALEKTSAEHAIQTTFQITKRLLDSGLIVFNNTTAKWEASSTAIANTLWSQSTGPDAMTNIGHFTFNLCEENSNNLTDDATGLSTSSCPKRVINLYFISQSPAGAIRSLGTTVTKNTTTQLEAMLTTTPASTPPTQTPQEETICPTGNCDSPRIAVNGTGKAILSWQEYTSGSDTKFYASSFDGTTWKPKVRVDPAFTGYAYFGNIMLNEAGNGILSFAKWTGAPNNTNQFPYATRFMNGSFLPSEKTSNQGMVWGHYPSADVDANNSFTLAYQDHAGGRFHPWTMDYVAGAWTAPKRTDNHGRDSQPFPEFVYTEAGSQLIIWNNSEDSGTPTFNVGGYPYSSRCHMYYTRKTNGGAWAAKTQLTTTESAADPKLASDREGNALGVWSQWDGSKLNVYASYFPKGAAVTAPVMISGNDAGFTSAQFPRVALSKLGGIVVWQHWIDATHLAIRGASVTFDSSRKPIWGKATTLGEGTTAGQPWHHRVAISGSGCNDDPTKTGFGVVTWAAPTGIIMLSRFSPTNGWSPTPETVSIAPADNYYPDLGISCSKDILVAYNHYVRTTPSNYYQVKIRKIPF